MIHRDYIENYTQAGGIIMWQKLQVTYYISLYLYIAVYARSAMSFIQKHMN